MTVGVFGLYSEGIKGRKRKFIAWDVREAGDFLKTAAEFVEMVALEGKMFNRLFTFRRRQSGTERSRDVNDH